MNYVGAMDEIEAKRRKLQDDLAKYRKVEHELSQDETLKTLRRWIAETEQELRAIDQ
jgi:urease accessory protein UreH